jgi:diacylglycerol kinase (ATP)
MHLVFIIHGKKKKISEISILADRNIRPGDSSEFLLTASRGDATQLVKQCFHRADVIIALGGDGTFHDCIIGFMEAKLEHANNNTQPTFVPWPCGSGNDFARNFNWRDNANEVMSRVYSHYNGCIDIGKIQYPDGRTTYFLNELSIGLGPEVVKIVDSYPDRWSGNFKFRLGVLGAFLSYRKKRIRLTWNKNQSYEQKVMACVIANGKYFGSGMGIAPSAKLSDGLLNMTMIGNVSLFDYIRQLKTLSNCEPIIHPEVFYYASHDITIHSNVPMEADGELIAGGPARITIEQAAINLK